MDLPVLYLVDDDGMHLVPADHSASGREYGQCPYCITQPPAAGVPASASPRLSAHADIPASPHQQAGRTRVLPSAPVRGGAAFFPASVTFPRLPAAWRPAASLR